MNLGDGAVDNFKLGAGQVDKIFLGRALVWPNTAITDFAASDSRVKEIQITFTDPNTTLPNSYELYQDGIRVATDVSSGDIFDAVAGSDSYYVRSIYDGGHAFNSNTDIGIALDGIAPGPITDFMASDDQILQVQSWWTNATGDPVPVYDLYKNGLIVAQNVVSGHSHLAEAGTALWNVVARNGIGESTSNLDEGTALMDGIPPPDGFIQYDIAGVYPFTVPPTVTSVRVCMIGGGGGGANEGSASVGGGWAGQKVTFTVPVTAGQTYDIVVGQRGIGAANDGANGGNGRPTTAFGTTVQGGLGGDQFGNYQGSGQVAPTAECITDTPVNDGMFFNNGGNYYYGGQAGLVNGPNGSFNTFTNEGQRGSGGGAGGSINGGHGGAGVVYITWNVAKDK